MNLRLDAWTPGQRVVVRRFSHLPSKVLARAVSELGPARSPGAVNHMRQRIGAPAGEMRVSLFADLPHE